MKICYMITIILCQSVYARQVRERRLKKTKQRTGWGVGKSMGKQIKFVYVSVLQEERVLKLVFSAE